MSVVTNRLSSEQLKAIQKAYVLDDISGFVMEALAMEVSADEIRKAVEDVLVPRS